MKKLVLVTRPLEQARIFANQLDAAGYQTLIAPLLHIEHYSFSYHEFQKPDLIVLSSMHALGDIPVPTDWADIPVLCVGSKTAESAKLAGFQHTIAGEGGIEALYPLIKERVMPSQHILYLRGVDIAHHLSADFPFLSVAEKITYCAKPVENFQPDIIQHFDKIDFITLFSRRSGAILKQLMVKNNLLPFARQIKLLCLSPSVIELVQDMGWQSCHVADDPTPLAMTEKLERLCDE